MLVEITEDALRAQGYVKADKFEDVMLSLPYVAEIIGCSATTIYEYAKYGLLKVNEDNKMPLSEVLQTSYKDLKRAYLDSKPPRSDFKSRRARQISKTIKHNR